MPASDQPLPQVVETGCSSCRGPGSTARPMRFFGCASSSDRLHFMRFPLRGGARHVHVSVRRERDVVEVQNVGGDLFALEIEDDERHRDRLPRERLQPLGYVDHQVVR